MAKQVFTNNARATLQSAITAASTSIALATGKGALFASPSGGDWQLATLTDGTNYEIVKITARSTDTLTVTRAQESTSARAWSANALIYAGVTKASLELLQRFDDSGNARGNLALDVQSSRGAVDQVASGSAAVAVGLYCKSSNDHTVAVGAEANATSNSDIAVGNWGVTASGGAALAIGSAALASGAYSTAVGQGTVASGAVATVVGAGSDATGSDSVAVGRDTQATAASAIGIGYAANASASNAIAVGYSAIASAAGALSIGESSAARVADAWNVRGANVIRKDNGESASDEHKYFAGCESVYFSKEIDLKTLADDCATITIPTGATFYPDEIGVVITSADTVTGNPDVSFGVTGNTTSLLASTTITAVTAKNRTGFAPLAKHGVNSLTASVKTAATGTTLLGRFYWVGMLVEDE